jgi:predicted transcriptional regulator
MRDSTTIRISTKTHFLLQEMAREENQPIQKLVERMLAEYRKKRYWEKANTAYKKLKEDPEAWREELEERKAWEATLSDDLTD